MKQLSLHLLSGLLGGLVALVIVGDRQETPTVAGSQPPAAATEQLTGPVPAQIEDHVTSKPALEP